MIKVEIINYKVVRVINIILFVVALISCMPGYHRAKIAEREAATDMSRIQVEIVEKKSYFDESNQKYCVDITYEFENKTKVDWDYLSLTTYVYDRSGKSLGTITSKFGYSSSFKLKAGQTIKQDSQFAEYYLDDFFKTLYESNLSELVLETEVTYGGYSE